MVSIHLTPVWFQTLTSRKQTSVTNISHYRNKVTNNKYIKMLLAADVLFHSFGRKKNLQKQELVQW